MGYIFDSVLLETVLGVLLIFYLVYKYMISSYSYWKDRSIVYVEPRFPFGTDKHLISFKAHIGQYFHSVYMNFPKERAVGMFSFHKPYLLIRDLELIKQIMTKDFHHFVDRGVVDAELLAPATRHLFHMQGEPWKAMRSKLTPAFTSGKMKMMFFLMEACANEFEKGLETIAERNENISIKDYIGRFTTDVIASCAFGLESDSIKNPDSEIRKHGSKILEVPPISEFIKHILAMYFPWVFKKIWFLQSFTNETVDFFMRIVGDTMEYREKNGVTRNDFIDILIKLKNNKSLLTDETNDNSLNDQKDVTNGAADLTLEDLTAQAIVFFAAGYETAASAMSFCLYEMSLNPEIQGKMRKEVDEVLTKHNGKMDYQALHEMPYVEAVINETLRRYSSLSILNRQCTEDYKFLDIDLFIPKGMKIFIPIYAIHHDPAYYPDPFRFNPERFMDGKISTKNNYTFMPFGEGPRKCIGIRFAMMQMKMCLSALLHKYEFSITEDTPLPPLILDTKNFFTNPVSPIILKISKV